MCIIIYTPAGVSRPSRSEIFRAWEANPDGGGIMYPADEGVAIEKGFMRAESLLSAVRAVPDGLPLVIHMRRATSGSVSPECCHPFPVTDDEEELTALATLAENAVAHNGIVGDGEFGLSDTQVFVRDVLAAPFVLKHWNESGLWSLLEHVLEGSKWAFMGADGNVRLVGHFRREGGRWYSNT